MWHGVYARGWQSSLSSMAVLRCSRRAQACLLRSMREGGVLLRLPLVQCRNVLHFKTERPTTNSGDANARDASLIDRALGCHQRTTLREVEMVKRTSQSDPLPRGGLQVPVRGEGGGAPRCT